VEGTIVVFPVLVEVEEVVEVEGRKKQTIDGIVEEVTVGRVNT
jgi:hypothetical protein